MKSFQLELLVHVQRRESGTRISIDGLSGLDLLTRDSESNLSCPID